LVTENPALTPEFTKKKFDFVAGNLCLDYCNTVGGKRGAIAREYLGSYSAFILWCEQAGLINKTKGRALMEHGAKHPTEAARVFARAVALREAIYRIFLDLSADNLPSKVDLATLNSELALALG